MRPGMLEVVFHEHRPLGLDIYILRVKCEDVRSLSTLCRSLEATSERIISANEKMCGLSKNDPRTTRVIIKKWWLEQQCFWRRTRVAHLRSRIRHKSLCILRKALNTPDELVARVESGIAHPVTRSANRAALLYMSEQCVVTRVAVSPDYDDFEPQGYLLAEVDLLMVGF